MGSSGPSWPDCSRLDIVAASIFAMLAAYSGSCVPETTLTCWTLNSLLCPFNMDIYIDAPLECGVVRHNWLCEWAILLFWEGLEYKSFVLKNENRDGVLFLFSYQATRVENGTIPMVSTCSRRVVYGQVKDWFLRSSYLKAKLIYMCKITILYVWYLKIMFNAYALCLWI